MGREVSRGVVATGVSRVTVATEVSRVTVATAGTKLEDLRQNVYGWFWLPACLPACLVFVLVFVCATSTYLFSRSCELRLGRHNR